MIIISRPIGTFTHYSYLKLSISEGWEKRDTGAEKRDKDKGIGQGKGDDAEGVEMAQLLQASEEGGGRAPRS
jgi:hypothetical protein